MTAIPQVENAGRSGGSARAVSERILVPLRQVAARQRRVRFGGSLLQFAGLALTLLLLAVFFLGVFPRMAVWGRLTIAAVADGAVLVAAVYFLRSALQRTALSAAAQQAERAFPELQERISSAVELSRDEDERFRGSPALISHLISQAEEQAGSILAQKVVSRRGMLRWLVLLIPVVAAWVVFAAVSPEVLGRGFGAVVKPWESTNLPTIQLVVDPGSCQIPAGDPLQVTARLIDPDASPRRKTIDHVSLVSRYASGQSVSTEMDLVDAKRRVFHAVLDDTRQDFDYRISAGEGSESQSPFYHVETLLRPAVSGMDIQYSYPAYTRLKDKTETSRDGIVDAVVGTRVRLIIHANQKLSTESRLLIAGTGVPVSVAASSLPLEPLAGNDYAVSLLLNESGQYAIHTVGQATYRDGDTVKQLTGKNDVYRPMIARPDAPPTVAILEPASAIKVRATDVVPIRWEAADDFGVERMEAIVQVDDRLPDIFQLPLVTSDPTRADGTFSIDVQNQLSRTGLAAARQISYQLKATDNSPNGQTALSARQILEIDNTVEPLATRRQRNAARDLQAAIDKGRERIARARQTAQDLEKADPARALTAEQTKSVEDAKNDLEQVRQDAAAAVRAQQSPSFQQTAERLKDVADRPVQAATDDLAKAQIAGDNAVARQQALQDADSHLADAQRKLDDLQRQAHGQQRETDLGQDIEQLAAQQRELARRMAQASPDEKGALAWQQRDLEKKIEALVGQNPDLQKPLARAVQPKVDEALKNLEQQQKRQQNLAQPDLARQAQEERARELQQKQEKLSEDIVRFAREQASAVGRAQASPPTQQDLDAIKQDLTQKRFGSSGTHQEQAASELDEAAARLQQQQKQMERAAEKAREDLAQDRRNVAGAADLQQKSQQLADAIQQAKAQNQPPTRPGDAANQAAGQLADDVQKAADEMARRDPASKAAATDIKQQAAAARQEAQQGQAEQAQQDLKIAADKLSNAAQQQAAHAQEAIDRTAAPDARAAQQARDLADRQRQLAKAASEAASAAEQDKVDPAATAQNQEQQRQLAQNLEQSAKTLDEVKQKTGDAAPRISQNASAAAQALRDAAQAQRDAAQAGQQNDSDGAAKAQKVAASALGQAQQALRQMDQAAGAGTPDGGEATATGGSAAEHGAQALQQARDAAAQAASGDAAAAEKAAKELDEAAHALTPAGAAEASGQSTPAGSSSGQEAARGATVPGGGGTLGGNAVPRQSAGSGGIPPIHADGTFGNGGGIGANPSATAINDARPAEVKDVGIPASDWAKLPPLMQQQLLNAAQQKGPPAYQELIKNYYVRIAHLQAEGQ
jgi:hypothetical protein